MFRRIVYLSTTWKDWFPAFMIASCGAVGLEKSNVFRLTSIHAVVFALSLASA